MFLLEKDSVEQKMKRLEAQYAAFQIVSLVGRYGSDQVTLYFITSRRE